MMQNKTKVCWLEIIIDAEPCVHEAISAHLFDIGFSGVAILDKKPHQLRAYLPADATSRQKIKLLRKKLSQIPSFFPGVLPPALRVNGLKKENWAENWRRFFQEEKVTNQLMVVPAWKKPPPDQSNRTLFMDPGPAFGTGKHPSTKLCLEALEKIPRPAGWSMLDVGTGSGILAIYGAMLGATRVLAIDIDPDALAWARRNAKLNKVQNKILFSATPVGELHQQFGVVTANLIYDTICQLREQLSGVTAPQGSLILSGLLKNQVDQIIDDFHREGFEVKDKQVMDEWVATTLIRKR